MKIIELNIFIIFKKKEIKNIEKVDKFLTDAEVFYLASVTEENKPKCRPLGFHMLEGDKIYFGVGTFKEVYAQITANPYVEIVATQSPKFIRYYGKADTMEKWSSMKMNHLQTRHSRKCLTLKRYMMKTDGKWESSTWKRLLPNLET